MMIVLEGADRTGKTTLAKELAVRLNYSYVHLGAVGKDPLQFYTEFLTGLKRDIICDRFFLSELVYGPMLRNTRYETNAILTLERLCRARGVLTIYATPPLGVVHERFRKSTDEFITLAQNEKAYLSFKNLMDRTSIPFWRYGGLYLADRKDMIARVEMHLRTFTKFYDRAKRVCKGAGTIMGLKIAFVAEPGSTKSLDILNSSMTAAEVKEKYIYVTPANTLTMTEVEFLEQTGLTMWVALGPKAEIVLSKLHVGHDTLFPPKRLEFDSKQKYIQNLGDIYAAFNRRRNDLS